jgi:hypothetical protein
MVSTPKDGDRHGGQGEKGSEPIPSHFDEMIRHQFFPLGVSFMRIIEVMRHAMVIRLTIMRVFSILLLSSISPAMSSAYAKISYIFLPPYPPSEQCTELWDPYGTQSASRLPPPIQKAQWVPPPRFRISNSGFS